MRALAVVALVVAAAVASAAAPPTRELLAGEDARPFTFTASHVGEVVFEDIVEQRGAAWLRIYFRKLVLGEHTLRLTSLADGAVQHLTSQSAQQWGLTTAYFNGDAVLVEVVAGSTLPSHVVLAVRHVQTDRHRVKPAKGSPAETASLCFAEDTRVFSNDTRSGRYVFNDASNYCTAWLSDAPGNCFLSAGHCSDAGDGIVQFNVPLSAEDGSLRHPGPEDQYVVDQESMQVGYNGINQDWRFFGVHPNTEHGLTPVQRYGGDVYRLIKEDTTPAEGTTIVITGFGNNEDAPASERGVQKTASGLFVGRSDDVLDYRVDTSNGNSGAAIFDADSGRAIGIHTNGGCNPSIPTSHNYGYSIFVEKLQAALSNPRGVCARRM